LPNSKEKEKPMLNFTIETLNLSRQYGKLTAVDNLNLKVPFSSVYGFLGPNGAGKTTTIRMLLGLIRPTQGQVQLFETPLENNPITLLGRMGALVESPSLYPHLTGYENLEVTRRLTRAKREQITRVLSIVKMEQDAHRRVREYSHGMRQRLALALALLSEPELLILDEPTNGLDPSGIREMQECKRQGLLHTLR
jgi:ABC-2 type transport system ATP-binding protein